MAHRAPIIIMPYDHRWPRLFAEEREHLKAVFPTSLFTLEHVGSTSVTGLAAKPIIDMMLGAPSLREIEVQIEQLIDLGYQYIPYHEQTFPQRRFFAKPVERPRHFHLHSVVIGKTFWREHIAFRDALRSSQKLADEYERLKRALATSFGDDREGYTHAKSDFIRWVING